MVYCGRPSTSCNNCRLKKRRCDKVAPECGQCQRTGQKCPGYRDLTSLTFRDESSRVIDKARSKDAKRAARQAERSSTRSASPQALPNPGLDVAIITSEAHVPSSDGLFEMDEVNLACLGFQDAFDVEDNLTSLHPGNVLAAPSSSQDMALPISSRSPRLTLGANLQGVPARLDGVASRANFQGLGTGCDGQHSQLSLDRPFSLSLDMVAFNYFLGQYVVRQAHQASGFFDYIIPVLADDNGHELLEGAILAVGYAGLAHTMRQGDLMSRSMTIYTRSMKQINLALAEPVAARQHSTIVTVLVLALYEFGRSSLQGWIHHIKGASTLLTVRGKSQFSTLIGAQIFGDVFSFLLNNCLLTGSPIPSSLRMLRIEALKTVSPSDVQWVTSSAVIELIDLYQRLVPSGYNVIVNGTLAPSAPGITPGAPRLATLPVESAERFLSQALEIDRRLECAFDECGPQWQYIVRSKSADAPFVHGDAYHLYPGMCVANVWNNMRAARMLANHAIGHLLLRGATIDSNWFFSNQYADQLQQVTHTIANVRNDMIASIPQLLGHVDGLSQRARTQVKEASSCGSDSGLDMTDTSSTSSTPAYASALQLDKVVYSGSAITGYFASWMLLMIGCLHNLGDDTRAWTVSQLRHVSSQTGLAQADDFAHCIEANKLRPPLS